MNTKFKYLSDFFKGVFVGLGCIIPGMSGGTAAMSVGIYERLLIDYTSFLSSPIKVVKDVILIVFGAASAILITAKPIALFHSKHTIFANLVFCIITALSTLFFITKCFKSRFKPRMLIFTFIGAFLAFYLSYTTKTTCSNSSTESSLQLFLFGCILALALVLPGISFSYMMLFLGIYDSALIAIHTFDLLFLIPLLIGIFLGTYVFSIIFLKTVSKYSTPVYCLILGFVIYSLSEILSKSLNC